MKAHVHTKTCVDGHGSSIVVAEWKLPKYPTGEWRTNGGLSMQWRAGQEGDKDTRRAWGDGRVHYLGCGDGPTAEHICQTSPIVHSRNVQ